MATAVSGVAGTDGQHQDLVAEVLTKRTVAHPEPVASPPSRTRCSGRIPSRTEESPSTPLSMFIGGADELGHEHRRWPLVHPQGTQLLQPALVMTATRVPMVIAHLVEST